MSARAVERRHEHVAQAGADQRLAAEVERAGHRAEQHDLPAGLHAQVVDLVVARAAERAAPLGQAGRVEPGQVDVRAARADQRPADRDRVLEPTGDDQRALVGHVDAEPVVVARAADPPRVQVGAGRPVERRHERVAHAGRRQLAPAEVDRRGERARQEHVAVRVDDHPLGPVGVRAAEHPAPQVSALAVELDDQQVAGPRGLPRAAAEVDAAVRPTQQDQVARAVDDQLGPVLVAAVAGPQAPQRVAEAVVLRDHDVRLALLRDQRLAAVADHALEVAERVDIALLVERDAAGDLRQLVAEPQRPRLAARGRAAVAVLVDVRREAVLPARQDLALARAVAHAAGLAGVGAPQAHAEVGGPLRARIAVLHRAGLAHAELAAAGRRRQEPGDPVAHARQLVVGQRVSGQRHRCPAGRLARHLGVEHAPLRIRGVGQQPRAGGAHDAGHPRAGPLRRQIEVGRRRRPDRVADRAAAPLLEQPRDVARQLVDGRRLLRAPREQRQRPDSRTSAAANRGINPSFHRVRRS